MVLMVKVNEMLLTPDKWVRPQTKLNKLRGVVWHWVANPNSSAKGNRNFWENRTGSYGSAHYIIGLDGEILRTLPEDEMGYHVGSKTYTQRSLNELGSYPNNNTIGIECTHINWDGEMTKETYNALIELTVDILKRHGLTADDIWLHQEIVGWKDCHRWFVNNPVEYKKAKDLVASKLNQKPVAEPQPVKKDEIVLVEADAKGMYEIKKGDTLWGISQALDVSVKEIEKLNPNVNPRELKVGQKIRVAETFVEEHVIAKGDTLWGLASKYKTTVAKLRELNKGIEATALQVGAKILVPTDGKVEPKKVEPKPQPKPEPKPQPKPAPKPEHKHEFKKLGRAKGNVWSHTKPDFSASTRKEVVKTNARLEVCCEENGLYYTNEGWISTKYVTIVGDLNKYDLPRVVLRRGSRGNAVVQVQRALNKLYFKCGVEDGSFGAKTEDALKRFQSVHCNPVDGVYGTRTELAMEKLLNK